MEDKEDKEESVTSLARDFASAAVALSTASCSTCNAQLGVGAIDPLGGEGGGPLEESLNS